jgi:hypothetical protein
VIVSLLLTLAIISIRFDNDTSTSNRAKLVRREIDFFLQETAAVCFGKLECARLLSLAYYELGSAVIFDPSNAYPRVFSSMDELLKWCICDLVSRRQVLNGIDAKAEGSSQREHITGLKGMCR